MPSLHDNLAEDCQTSYTVTATCDQHRQLLAYSVAAT